MGADKKEVYFWQGEKNIRIDRIYVKGEKIPHAKMDQKQFAKMVEDGRIKKTAIDVDVPESGSKKKIKELSQKIVELNKSNGTDRIEELEGELTDANDRISDLQGEATTATERIEELEGEATTAGETIDKLEAEIVEMKKVEE